jgi:hypothetical protein
MKKQGDRQDIDKIQTRNTYSTLEPVSAPVITVYIAQDVSLWYYDYDA